MLKNEPIEINYSELEVIVDTIDMEIELSNETVEPILEDIHGEFLECTGV